MKLVEKIFRDAKYSVTSPFGWRVHPITGANQFHNGTDYGTGGVKYPQYAVEDGKVLNCGRDSTGAIFAYVEYPRIGKVLMHYHLDSLCVVKGQSVNSNSKIGYTGTTGNSTGIHLHLSLFNTSEFNKGYYDRNYENPETYNYQERVEPTKTIEELANEVIAGKWGNNPERKNALIAAGYDYNAIQARVDELVKGNAPTTDFKVGDIVIPTRLVDYNGTHLKQYDANYVISELNGNRAVLKARGTVWAAMNTADIKKA